MLALDRGEAGRDEIEGFIPADRLPLIAVTPHRSAQPIGIVVDVDERDGLRAHVAAAERVRGIAANAHDLRPSRADLDAAERLAQVAGAVCDAIFRWKHGGPSSRPGS